MSPDANGGIARPTHRCQLAYCTNTAPYWRGPIVIVGDSAERIVGWCGRCERYVCSECALRLEVPSDLQRRLPAAEAVDVYCRRWGLSPEALHCLACGTVLRKGRSSDILMLHEARFVATTPGQRVV